FSDGSVFHNDGGANNIFLGQDTNGDGIPDLPHNLQTGEEVIYHADGSPLIGGLQNDTPYWVIRKDQWTIQLAATLDDANNGKAITLTPDKSSDAVDVKQFLRVSPLGNLKDGVTYYVLGGVTPTSFQLAATPGGPALNVSGAGSAGLHHFFKAGIA